MELVVTCECPVRKSCERMVVCVTATFYLRFNVPGYMYATRASRRRERTVARALNSMYGLLCDAKPKKITQQTTLTKCWPLPVSQREGQWRSEACTNFLARAHLAREPSWRWSAVIDRTIEEQRRVTFCVSSGASQENTDDNHQHNRVFLTLDV